MCRAKVKRGRLLFTMPFLEIFLQFLFGFFVYHGAKAESCTPSRQGVSDEDVDEILQVHNTLRLKVANGQQGNQSSASNMNELTWNSELTSTAQTLADSCAFEHDIPTIDGFTFIGQNLYKSSVWGSASEDSTPTWSTAIQSWYDEVEKFKQESVTKYQFDSDTGHYTQVVWATTKEVGCGYVFYKDDIGYNKQYVCNYGPGGNIIDEPMYLEGDPCSQCTSCSTAYPGLCAS